MCAGGNGRQDNLFWDPAPVDDALGVLRAAAQMVQDPASCASCLSAEASTLTFSGSSRPRWPPSPRLSSSRPRCTSSPPATGGGTDDGGRTSEALALARHTLVERRGRSISRP